MKLACLFTFLAASIFAQTMTFIPNGNPVDVIKNNGANYVISILPSSTSNHVTYTATSQGVPTGCVQDIRTDYPFSIGGGTILYGSLIYVWCAPSATTQLWQYTIRAAEYNPTTNQQGTSATNTIFLNIH